MSVKLQPVASIFQHLLREISFDGKQVAKYRKGGLGHENVLTAEVLQGLDFLPRQHFLGAIINALNGNIDETRSKLIAEIENASLTFLPDPFPLKLNDTDQSQTVQPDGLLVADRVFAFIEAKRFRGGSFQTEQLARELVIVARESKHLGRVPLLVLFLGQKPPVKIERGGRKAVRIAITDKLDTVLRKTDSPYSASELENMIDQVVAWMTWDDIAEIVSQQLKAFADGSPSTHKAIERVAMGVVVAIQQHRKAPAQT